MNRAKNVNDPIERNMMISLQQFTNGGVAMRPPVLAASEIPPSGARNGFAFS
jgi:hypothetical protein